MKHFFFVLFFLHTLPAKAQQANIWYFGDKAGIDFKQGTPIALSDGQLRTQEGVATICDKEGKLLFYTDGSEVYNAQHKVMPNGKYLKGGASSTQSAIIIPHRTLINQYYIFTVAPEARLEGLCYTVVDMSLEKGLGDVIPKTKNTFLYAPISEKLTAIMHKNKKDVWVITHEWKSNKFLAYLISEKGVTATPITSEVGNAHLPLKTDWGGSYANTHGYLKSNPTGTKIALALAGEQLVEILDFDSATGKISNPISFKVQILRKTPEEMEAEKTTKFPSPPQVYGVEFSPNGSLLYISILNPNRVYQYNLQTKGSIATSQVEIIKMDKKNGIGALQLAPDEKIYVSTSGRNFLSVIQEPNLLGTACSYEADAIELKGKATYGLPNFVQGFLNATSNNLSYFDKNTIKVGDKLILSRVQFDYGLSSLVYSSFTELDALVNYMQKYPRTTIKLSGHTDDIGNEPANVVLSQNRAKAIKDYLVGKHIAESRISFEGFGSSVPLFSNDTEESRAKNRRVEVAIFEK